MNHDLNAYVPDVIFEKIPIKNQEPGIMSGLSAQLVGNSDPENRQRIRSSPDQSRQSQP